MRQTLYPIPCPGSFELIALEGDNFVGLPGGMCATGEGHVFVYTTLTGRTGYVLEGCVAETSLDEIGE